VSSRVGSKGSGVGGNQDNANGEKEKERRTQPSEWHLSLHPANEEVEQLTADEQEGGCARPALWMRLLIQHSRDRFTEEGKRLSE
jgi:hypothetical protein